MQPSNLIVRIPEPCHEDWNAMQPDAKGKFCNSCSKSVFDFSNKTDAEIKNILIEYKDQKVCGHFRKSQIDRPLNISINVKDLPKNISMTKVFVIAVFLAFGTMLFSCTNDQGQKVGEIEVVDNRQQQTTMGMALPLPPLPIDTTNTVITGDTVIEAETSCSQMLGEVSSEEYVDGGIGYDEVYLDEVPVITEYAEPILDEMIVGMMVMPYEQRVDTASIIQVDATTTENSERITNSEITGKSTVLSIYPNPGNGEFTIKYDVVKRADVRIEIFDMKGVLVRTVVSVSQQYEGKYQIPTNLNELPNGTYIVTLINNEKKTTERLVIAR